MRKTNFKLKTSFWMLALCFMFMLPSCTHGIKSLNSCDDVDFPLENVFKSTVFVDGRIIDKKTKKVFFKYTGSGGIVWQGVDSTIVMTAAHVCDAERSLKLVKKDAEFPEDVVQTVKIHDRDNRVYPVISYVAATEFDLCMMHVSKITNAPAIKIDGEEPELGDAVYNIASPIGIFSSDGSPMFKGYYSGDYKFLSISQEKSSLFSLPAAPGSSGSLLLNKNQEVIGVVSAVYVRFHHLTISPTVKQIRTLMAGEAKTRDKLFINFDPPLVVEEKIFLWGKEVPEWNPKEIDIYIVP